MMVRIARCLLAVSAVLLAQVPLTRADEEVDLLLVLAVDVSRSIDQTKFLLQRDGYAAAISNRGVLEAIRSGPHQKIGLNFVEWSGFGAQKLVIDWTVVDSPDTARRFGDQIVEAPRSFADRTSISGGIEFAAAQIERSPLKAPRHIIDVSGDGTNNIAPSVTLAREDVVSAGITINGLPIMLKRPWGTGTDVANLDVYYEDCVIGGPGAFVIAIHERDQFKEATRTKLVLEIAGLTPPPRVIPAQATTPRSYCW
jgi:hypothetical protein